MTTEDDPFGRSDRTIIRPNPAGRRTPAAIARRSAPPASPAGGRRASLDADPACRLSAAAASRAVQRALVQPRARRQRGWDDWMTPRAPNNLYVAPEASTPMTPAPMSPHVSVDLVTVAASPLMRAAASLLLLLGRLRASLARAGASQLMDQVAQAIEQFEIDARAAGAPDRSDRDGEICARRHRRRHRAESADERQPGLDAVQHAGSLLQRADGRRPFLQGARARQAESCGQSGPARGHARLPQPRLRRASIAPRAARARCRASGAISTRRSAALSRRRSRILSPHWRGQDVPLVGQPSPGSRLGGGGACGGRSARLLSLSAQRALRRAETLALRMAEIHPARGIDASRAKPAVKPPPDPKPRTSTQLERIRAALAKEIMAGKVGADQIGDDDLHSHRQRRAVSFGRREGQRRLRADRRQDRRRARPGAGRHSRRRLHRRRSDSHRRLPVELRALGGARQVGRGHAEAGPRASRAARGDGQGPRQSGRSERHRS